MHNYEVCVVQVDVFDSDTIKRTACRHFDYSATEASINDAQGRCDSVTKCLNVKNNANQNTGDYELLSVEI